MVSDKEFSEAWNSSTTISEVLRKIGVVPAGGNYSSAKNRARRLGLGYEHFTGIPSDIEINRGKKKVPLEKILTEDSFYASAGLRKRLIKENILDEKCSAPFCSTQKDFLDPFTGETSQAPLELDHIDGDNRNNKIENLRLLCSNCHSMTHTFRGKNIGRIDKLAKSGRLKRLSGESLRSSSLRVATEYYCECGNQKTKNAKVCRLCFAYKRDTKIDWPVKDDLKKLVQENGFSGAGRILGVSDNAIRKRIKSTND